MRYYSGRRILPGRGPGAIPLSSLRGPHRWIARRSRGSSGRRRGLRLRERHGGRPARQAWRTSSPQEPAAGSRSRSSPPRRISAARPGRAAARPPAGRRRRRAPPASPSSRRCRPRAGPTSTTASPGPARRAARATRGSARCAGRVTRATGTRDLCQHRQPGRAARQRRRPARPLCAIRRAGADRAAQPAEPARLRPVLHALPRRRALALASMGVTSSRRAWRAGRSRALADAEAEAVPLRRRARRAAPTTGDRVEACGTELQQRLADGLGGRARRVGARAGPSGSGRMAWRSSRVGEARRWSPRSSSPTRRSSC